LKKNYIEKNYIEQRHTHLVKTERPLNENTVGQSRKANIAVICLKKQNTKLTGIPDGLFSNLKYQFAVIESAFETKDPGFEPRQGVRVLCLSTLQCIVIVRI
jgi:hypothetical protein